MSKWPGKIAIGLTGNIATGKSVVRGMLEQLGAATIDADALAHRAIARGAPGYQPALDMFGRWILGPDQQIDRRRLGRVVFSDPQALRILEGIIHPLVHQAVDYLVRRSEARVVVIEAIKLLETDLRNQCDSIWVTSAPVETQVQRMVENRAMSAEEAHQRIAAQPPPEEKIAAADVVIENGGSLEDTWQQVQAAWDRLVPPTEPLQPPDPAPAAPAVPAAPAAEPLQVTAGRPSRAEAMADLVSRSGSPALSADALRGLFGENAYLLLEQGERLVGMLGWQAENLVARAAGLWLDPLVSPQQAIPPLVQAMEQAAAELQCEAGLVFVTPELASQADLWRSLGYEPSGPAALSVPAWQEAARESMPEGTVLLFKQLRANRVLRPI